jgi:hypothetical protein
MMCVLYLDILNHLFSCIVVSHTQTRFFFFLLLLLFSSNVLTSFLTFRASYDLVHKIFNIDFILACPRF